MLRVSPLGELGQSVQRGAVAVHRPPGGQDAEDVHEETRPHHLPGLQRARTEILKVTRLSVSFSAICYVECRCTEKKSGKISSYISQKISQKLPEIPKALKIHCSTPCVSEYTEC